MKGNANYKKRFFVFIFIGFSLMLINCCKKDKPTSPVPETGTVTDVEGNVYKTVKIGNQWWMAENLKVSKYRDLSLIQKIQEDTAHWRKDTAGAYCVYDNNSENTKTYGFLYNWYAIHNSRGIAPNGWHIPSDGEWKELEEHLGMNPIEANKVNWRGTHEGEKLKIASKQGWTTYSTIWSTNESGFTALAGGCRLFNGAWPDFGLFSTGFWWSATDRANGEAWYRYLDYKNANVFRNCIYKNYGFSVRCVKNS